VIALDAESGAVVARGDVETNAHRSL